MALNELLTMIAEHSPSPLRITIFGEATTNGEYTEQRQKIESAIHSTFNPRPMLAYIAQAPLYSTLAAEVMTLKEQKAQDVVYHERYIIINDTEIISGGIYSQTQKSIDQQAEDIFAQVGEILARQDVKTDDIVRQWNYIERITNLGDNGQHYQLFNDARSKFYNSCQWDNGYPAATGIGAQVGGVVVVFDAIRNSKEHSTAIDNPLQISAHAYSQQVLINNVDTHKTTPKFERARHIDGQQPMIHISGTAAIRGEESCQQEIVGQTALTMENIDYLISSKNQLANGVKCPTDMEYATMRIYIKHRNNLHDVKAWMADNYPQVDALYLWADICREELLIEIEGIAAQKES